MKLTILMYHKIDELREGVRYPGNYVSPKNFEQQMDALLQWGYRTITFDQWLDGRNLPARPLIVTFDDGYSCFDENAWPILRARSMGAMVFLVASQIGGTNAWDADEIQVPLLSADRIRALHAEGVRFGSHTSTHPALTEIPLDRARDELVESRRTLSAIVGADVDVLAYPYSNQNAAVRDAARDAGYSCAVRGKGRMNRRGTDRFGLYRIKVEPDTTVDGLRRVLFRERYIKIV